ARIQFMLFVITIVINILWSYFGVYKQVELNSYRLAQIEKDREIKWDNQTSSTEKQLECINEIKLTLAEITTDIKYIKKGL
ncbi:MAG: hypothetical protein OEV44_11070, partial [Spirochaetota bacterium]|nr:hypothetical protein [Spirochaetota bacterium]